MRIDVRHKDLKDQLRAVAFTTATPFTEGAEEIDHNALTANLKAMQAAGAELFIPCGNTGEYYSLSHQERIEVVRTHVDAIGKEGTIVAGLAGGTKTALELIQAYEAAGVDGIMVMHPDHTYAHERGLRDYYLQLAEAAEVGVVLYKRNHDVSRQVVAEISAHKNVVGVKYAVDDVADFAATIAEGSDDCVWLNGIAERYALPFAIQGAEGYTTGIGNFAPKATLALFDAIEACDWARARSLQELLHPFEDLREARGADNHIASANNVPAVKYGLDLADLHGGPVREPLVELCSEDKQQAEEYYHQFQDAAL